MPFHNLVPVLLLAAVISLHAAHPAAAASNTTSTVTLIVGAGGCTGHSWGENGSKFGYSVLLTQLNVTGTCNATNVRISKLYIDGACASSRDNSLSLGSPSDLTCKDEVKNADDTTICQDVLGSSSSNWVAASTIAPTGVGSAGEVDTDSICSTSNKDTFTFVQNNCTEAVQVMLSYTVGDYTGGTCLEVAGHSLSKGVIIVIVVIGVVALILLAILIKCCCFCL